MRKVQLLLVCLMFSVVALAAEKVIKLPKPNLDRTGSVMKALSERHSTREFAAKALSLSDLSDLLYNQLPSTWWMRDAAFLRLKNIEVGYEFDKSVLQRLRMENLRVYVQGNNVAVWDKIKYWDPELGNANSGAKYPLCRNFTVGLEITY